MFSFVLKLIRWEYWGRRPTPAQLVLAIVVALLVFRWITERAPGTRD